NECMNGPNIFQNILSKQQFFSPNFFSFCHQFFNGGTTNSTDFNEKRLKELHLTQKKKFEEHLNDSDQDLFLFLKGIFKEKSIFPVNANDFESPNFFLEDIANEERDYQLKKTQNYLNIKRAEDGEEI